MVVFSSKGGVTVTQSVHHGAARDNDGGKEGADTVLKGWKLSIERRVKSNVELKGLRTSLFPLLKRHPHPLTLLMRRPILLLDSLLEFTVRPVEQDLCALAGYQQTLHLAHRHSPVLLHCGILSIPQSLRWEEKKREKIKAIVQNKQWSYIHSCSLSALHIADCELSRLKVVCSSEV